MQTGNQKGQPGLSGAELVKNHQAIAKLAKSSDAQQLVALLNRRGGTQEAARAASQGDPGQLMDMVRELMNSQEGATLLGKLREQARQAGLE